MWKETSETQKDESFKKEQVVKYLQKPNMSLVWAVGS